MAIAYRNDRQPLRPPMSRPVRGVQERAGDLPCAC